MDFELNHEQRMMQASVREALKREVPTGLVRELEQQGHWFHQPLWEVMAKTGWLGIAIPPAYGGQGGDLIDQAILCAELGRALAPSAYLATAPCAALVIALGTEAQKGSLLPGLASGRSRAALALCEPDMSPSIENVRLQAMADGKGFALSGTKVFVHGGDGADTFLWAARHAARSDGGPGLFLVDTRAPGVSVSRIETLVPDGQVEVTLDNVRLPQDALLGNGQDASRELKRTLDCAVLLKCVEGEAMARAALAMAVEYAKVRVQYGRPIGSFQAVQHRLVNAYFDLEAAWTATWQAVWTMAATGAPGETLEIAKLATLQALDRVAEEAHIVHAGMGFLQRYDLHLYTRRMMAAATYLGSAGDHREALARSMGL